ncbi:MAG: AgmX/PglI C-terminal domain-containing protein, partial [Deltaproteobacteria bacterium]|nr:AgmX/PglI C-terminal domain-containing protein [Deltaproteobacteria bacterium]
GAWLLRVELAPGPKAQNWDKEIYRNLGKSGAPEKTKPSCLRQAQGALASGLQVVHRAPPESRDMMLVRTWTETLPQLDCAMREADTREHAKDLVSAWSLMLAKRRGRAFDQQTQLIILDSACKRAIEAACLQAKDVRAKHQIELPSTELRVGFPLPRTEVIQLRANDRTQVKPNNLGQTIAHNRALSRSMSTYEQDRNSRAELLLAVEGQTSIKAFDELLSNLGVVGAERVAILLRSPSGVRAVDIELSSMLHSDTPSPKAKQVEAGPKIRGMLGLAKQEATLPNIPDRFARLETPRKLDHKPIQHPAVLTVSSSGFLLRSLGRIHRLSRKDPQGATEFMRELRQAEPLYIKAVEDSHFSDLAFGLAMAVDANSKRTVLMGPPPPIVLEAVKQKQGLLAILGNRGNPGGLSTVLGGGISSGGGAGVGISGFVGSVDPGPIRRVIRSKLAVFRNCYERELSKNPTLKGKITVTWVINAKGKVAKISKIESTMKSEPVINCIKAKIKSLRFPAPKDGKDRVVRYPFIFKPKK